MSNLTCLSSIYDVREAWDVISIMTSPFSSKALWADSWREKRLSKFLQYFTDREEQADAQGRGFLNKPTAKGFRVIISSTTSLLTYFAKELGYHYLLVARH
ncbi:hypothetical protein IscW_ISCW005485 [Ixodes scapularis]|uniref:Uncharacterized protein n=1 Tax=Ixodes scapularis TaxID=6945 RepID=B7PNR0_IXOSC|nr:hypothetical protein IscW_ISCW005485 [Ixodes scapularis]|eukprot:XP_002435402.1 hypothetical protein IscW_ISCW005485 [Ixodes scapularis]